MMRIVHEHCKGVYDFSRAICLNPDKVLKMLLKSDSLPVKFSHGGSWAWFRFDPQCGRFPIRVATRVYGIRFTLSVATCALPGRTASSIEMIRDSRNGALRMLAEGSSGFR